jgi:catechol 2,3-dioxygenase-like lactoylglutathione lyase family enzyme
MVVLHVEDQEAAKRFWVDTLGFTLAEDTPHGEKRWLSVLSPDGATEAGPELTGDALANVRVCPTRFPASRAAWVASSAAAARPTPAPQSPSGVRRGVAHAPTS